MSHLLTHPYLRHPLTGEPLQAVGVSRRGPIWPIIGAAEGDPPPADPPSADPPKHDPPKPADPPESTFKPPESQADLDRIINDRLARERAKYSDYADLKKKAQAHDKALEDAKSEQDKAVDAARKEGESAAIERANTRLVNAEVRALAAAAKFHDPTDAISQLRGTGKLDGVKIADDGTVDSDAVQALLKDLAEAKPYLVVDDSGKPAPSFGGGPRKTEPTRAGSLGEAVRNRIAAGNR